MTFAQPNEMERIDAFLDEWHHAASVADESVFFGSMTEDCIYIGTDISEKWKRDELKQWSAKYFDAESAWDFKPFDREIYLKGDIAWFDEKLKTWMGDCRASGVVVKVNDTWKLQHYHLSVTVPNEKIQGFIDLVNKEE